MQKKEIYVYFSIEREQESTEKRRKVPKHYALDGDVDARFKSFLILTASGFVAFDVAVIVVVGATGAVVAIVHSTFSVRMVVPLLADVADVALLWY